MLVSVVVKRENAVCIVEDEVWGTAIGMNPSIGARLWVPREPLGPVGGCDNKEGGEYKCEEVVVTSVVDGYDLECITEDATWGVVLDDIPVISVSDLLSLLIIQIHCNFI